MSTLLESVFDKFQVESEFKSYKEINSGHINDTFLIKTTGINYVLQRINGNVFKDAANLVVNKVLVSSFLQSKYKHLTQQEIYKKVLCFVKTKHNTFFYKDEEANIWNLSIFIENTVTYLKTPNSIIAYEAGKITGEFLKDTTGFNTSKLKEILPDFHSVTKRYKQFKDSLRNTSKNKINQAIHQINFIEKYILEMCQIDLAIENGEIKKRLTHSDTKISNILFSEDKALCLIDTDTVMSGIIHFDYGDAIRTICNMVDEDEKDLKLVSFNLEYFKNYTKGFFEQFKNVTEEEKKYLSVSIKMMPYIMGLRFLTDFLNDNIYYKISYENHNLDRAKNQFAYIKSIDKKYSEIKAIIEEELS